ncbi:caspase family protein [bacterium]|nr:caspase family protein [bacterium]
MKKVLVLIVLLGVILVGIANARVSRSSSVLRVSVPKIKKVSFKKFKVIKAKNIEIVKKLRVSRFSRKSFFNFPFFNFSHFHFSSRKAATGILGEKVKGNKYAIIIGISDYPGEESDLNFADDDAKAMAQVLKDKYEFSDKNIYSFIDDNAKAQAIFDKINELKERTTSLDEVVFFFSGHGVRGMAQDGDREIIDEGIVIWGDNNDFFYLWDGQLKEWFEDFPTKRIVFIFDSCLAGGMDDLAKEGRIVNMATWEFGRFSSAVELDELCHGEFSYYFVVDGIDKGNADQTPEDGVVTDEEAFDWAKENCRYDRPTINDQFENDLVF